MNTENKTGYKSRQDIPKQYKWDIEHMFPDESAIETHISEIEDGAERFTLFRGRLSSSASNLLEAFMARDAVWQKLEKIFVYAHMKRDENNTVSKYQAMTDKCRSLAAKVSAAMSFFTPELSNMPETLIKKYLGEEPGLNTYAFFISDTLREKKHVLSKAEENVIANFSEVTGALGDIFTMLNNADMKFGNIKDENGNDVELTHGNYINLMKSKERKVRRQAFEHMYKPYMSLINTISATYTCSVKTDVVGARLRKYKSARAAALSADNVPLSVYENLIDIVNETLPVIHKYMAARKRLLGVDELHMYDIYVPLIDIPKEIIPYEVGLKIINEALKPLGDEYLLRMNNGFRSRWVDVYETPGKTSGAYSFGSYDSMPYMLLNYTDTLQDVFTVIHETGHSMHSSYTRENQPFIYGGHSIFTAEVASTVNESLLMKYLLKKEKDKTKYLYILNMYIEAFRTTLFRQTMFAEFEKLTHELVENGRMLTSDLLCEEYGKLNEKYFGPNVTNDEQISFEWARIPHFYNAFYVYKYATGYSAATAISEKILNEGEPAQKRYIEFLKTGESNYPIELLKGAGIDMSTETPVKSAMDTFKKLVDEFCELA